MSSNDDNEKQFRKDMLFDYMLSPADLMKMGQRHGKTECQMAMLEFNLKYNEKIIPWFTGEFTPEQKEKMNWPVSLQNIPKNKMTEKFFIDADFAKHEQNVAFFYGMQSATTSGGQSGRGHTKYLAPIDELAFFPEDSKERLNHMPKAHDAQYDGRIDGWVEKGDEPWFGNERKNTTIFDIKTIENTNRSDEMWDIKDIIGEGKRKNYTSKQVRAKQRKAQKNARKLQRKK